MDVFNSGFRAEDREIQCGAGGNETKQNKILTCFARKETPGLKTVRLRPLTDRDLCRTDRVLGIRDGPRPNPVSRKREEEGPPTGPSGRASVAGGPTGHRAVRPAPGPPLSPAPGAWAHLRPRPGRAGPLLLRPDRRAGAGSPGCHWAPVRPGAGGLGEDSSGREWTTAPPKIGPAPAGSGPAAAPRGGKAHP